MGVPTGADSYFAQMNSDEIRAEIKRLEEEARSKKHLIERAKDELWLRRSRGAASHYNKETFNGA